MLQRGADNCEGCGDCEAALKGYDAVIFVYDNNSTDETARLAAEAGAVVRREPMQGKGNVVRRMFREIDAHCYVMLDGDDTYDASAIPAMVDEVLKDKTDMVVGDRLSSTYFTENKRLFHNSGNVVVRGAINHIFHSDIRDVMTGLRAFSFQFVKTFPVLSAGFEIETEMTIHAVDKGMQVKNCVAAYRDRPKGSVSKLNTVSDGLRVLGTIARLFRGYRPLTFFSLLAAVLAVLAVAVLVPTVIVPYMATGLVLRFPTLIVCCFVGMAALLSLYAGLILDLLRQKERREFEFRLQTVRFFERSKKNVLSCRP